MNYIKQLQEELKESQKQTALLIAGLDDMRSYLTHSKFHIDTTVQVSDILHRISETIHTAMKGE